MEKRRAYDLIYLGLIIRHLQSLNGSYNRKDCLGFFDDLENQLKESGLYTSLSAYNAYLKPIRNELKKSILKTEIGNRIKAELQETLQTLEKIVYSEARIKNIYVIPQRRYNSEYLDSNPLALLNKSIIGKLPEMAIFDFSSSCRCLLYGEATACAFHILRATEEVLRHYYSTYRKSEKIKKLLWAPMIKELRSIKNGPDKFILDSLDIVRINYRNPTQHPDSIYDIESTQDLFGLCIDLINKMGIKLESS